MKTKIQVYIAIVSLFSSFFSSCNDLVDKNLSSLNIIVLSPRDSFISYNYDMVFQWEAIEGINGYRFQVAQPSFLDMQLLVVDTFLTSTKYTVQLLPGKYQWRLRAENGTYSTPFVTRQLTIDSNRNLNGQQFQTLSPTNNYITNQSNVLFSWQSFPYANKYEFVLMDTAGNVTYSTLSMQTTIQQTLAEGSFLWKARALDTLYLTATAYSSAKKITIDTSSPLPSSPSIPLNNATDTNIVQLIWLRTNDCVGDSVFVSTDIGFSNYSHKAYIKNGNEYSLPLLGVNQDYYWRIRSHDLAGNWSGYSVTFKFHVN